MTSSITTFIDVIYKLIVDTFEYFCKWHLSDERRFYNDLIDYDIIVSDVISSFRSVLDALNLEEIYFKTPNGNANLTSCLISL